MYLHGFLPGLSSDPSFCREAGGTPQEWVMPTSDFYAGAAPKSQWRCYMPDKPAAANGPAANISVNVPTNVNTQVSPQISPAFVQQDNPSNSPVNTAASSAPAQSTAASEWQEYLKQKEQLDAEREARLYETLKTQAVSTPQPIYAPLVPGDAPPAVPVTFPQYVQDNIVPIAVAAAALLSIFAMRKRKV